MKIGQLVQLYIKKIFQFCEVTDHGELTRFMDKKYSKNNFDINYPFCTEVTSIAPENSRRYWTDIHEVQGKAVRVSSQWLEPSRSQFIQYLTSKNISTSEAMSSLDESVDINKTEAPRPIRKNGRYRGNSRCMFIANRINEFEKDICFILAQLAFHIHPKIIEKIQKRNSDEFKYFAELFDNRIDVHNYLFDGSACVFPGVKRYISRKGKKKEYNPEYRAIIDDNTFPRHYMLFPCKRKNVQWSQPDKFGLGGI